MANILRVDIADMGEEALRAEEHARISSTCTVFAESEVISQLAKGAKRSAVVAGICDSVAARTATLAKRIGIKEPVCMSGGVAHNVGVRAALEKALGVTLLYSPQCQHFGAIGAAVYAMRKHKKA
jgi:predicted CoA-substrate-specific enzyme activase